jgi:O-antigen ligase
LTAASAVPPALHLATDADLPVPETRRGAAPIVLAGLVAVVVGVGVGVGWGLYVAVLSAALVIAVASFYSERGLLYVLALVPFCESLGVGPMSVGRIMAVVAVLVLLTKFLGGRLPARPLPNVSWLPAAAFTLVILSSGLWAASFGAWTFAVGQVALAIVYFAAFAFLVQEPQHIVGILRVYVVGAVASAGLAFYEAAIGLRAEGLQGDPNIFGLYQVAALPAAFALARLSHGVGRLLWILASLPILGSIVASQSRGALLALVATAFVLALYHRRRRVLVPLVAGAGLMAYTLAPLIDDRYAAERVSSDRASGRIDIWFTAWQAFLDHPLTGIGAGNYVPQSIERLTTEPGVELIKSHLLTGQGIEVHNIYLEALAERGLFGLLTLLSLLGCALWCLRRAARRFPHPAVSALEPMLVAYCVASVFLSVSNSKLLWMLIGLGAALLAIPPEDRHPGPLPIPALRSSR